MKKDHSEWHKQRLKRADIIREKRRDKWNRKRRNSLKFQPKFSYPRPLAGRTKIVVPDDFSFITNPEACLTFFENLEFSLHTGMEVRLNMRGITNPGLDALLYLVATLDHYGSASKGSRVIGNLPLDEKAKRIIVASGFLERVTASGVHRDEHDEDSLPIQRLQGLNVDNGQVSRLYAFCKAHHVGESDVALKSINKIVLELMSNTRKWAAANVERVAWYSLALYSPDTKSVQMAFLDRGRGIPATMQRKKLELLFPPEEYELLSDALKGTEFRSHTGQKWRGNGLPRVKQGFDRKKLYDLFIISGGAHLDLNKKGRTLPKQFKGTLFSWTIAPRAGR